jgi:ABC-type xylose transport system substrate-binding protein
MKGTMGRNLLCLLALALVIGLAACCGEAAQSKKIVIGVAFDFLQVERRVISRDNMFKYAEAEGWQIDFQDAKGDE